MGIQMGILLGDACWGLHNSAVKVESFHASLRPTPLHPYALNHAYQWKPAQTGRQRRCAFTGEDPTRRRGGQRTACWLLIRFGLAASPSSGRLPTGSYAKCTLIALVTVPAGGARNADISGFMTLKIASLKPSTERGFSACQTPELRFACSEEVGSCSGSTLNAL